VAVSGQFLVAAVTPRRAAAAAGGEGGPWDRPVGLAWCCTVDEHGAGVGAAAMSLVATATPEVNPSIEWFEAEGCRSSGGRANTFAAVEDPQLRNTPRHRRPRCPSTATARPPGAESSSRQRRDVPGEQHRPAWSGARGGVKPFRRMVL
jgi:hypothetical protein